MSVPTRATLAERTLARLGLDKQVAADPEFIKWLARQKTVTVDGRKLYLVGGDRLADEGELKLGWAVERGVADAAAVETAQREITGDDPAGDGEFANF